MPAFFLSFPGLIAVTGIAALLIHNALRHSAGVATSGNEADRPTFIVQVAISLVVLAAALYVILARPDAPDDHKWAYSIVGTIVGYWLKAAS